MCEMGHQLGRSTWGHSGVVTLLTVKSREFPSCIKKRNEIRAIADGLIEEPDTRPTATPAVFGCTDYNYATLLLHTRYY